MAKLQSTFINMLLSLALICLVSAGLLAFVYKITKEPIAQAEQAKQKDAIEKVVAGFNNNPADEKTEVTISDGSKFAVFPAKKDGEIIGVAIEANTTKGFSGEIKVMVGFDINGKILNYSVLQHAETPGLGSKMDEWFRPAAKKEKSLVEKIFGFEVKSVDRQSSIIDLNPATDKLAVAKDGGKIDAITAATISSKAFLDAVERAYEAFQKSGLSAKNKVDNEQ